MASDFHGTGVRISAGRGLGCGGCFSFVLGPVLGCGITALVFGTIELTRRASDAAAVAAFARCPVVTAALGVPIEEAAFSPGCGESETGGGSGEAEWTIRIRGPKGPASGWYAATYRGGGPWVVHAASVTLPDGRQVSAVPCEGGAAPPDPAPVERERDRDGERDRDRDDRGGGGGGGGGKAGKGRR